MSNVLWQVLNNITPDFDETVGFNLRPGELPIFQTGNCVTYAEERTVTANHSRFYQGMSLPVGGGIYYHIGGSQGHQERTSGLLPLDGGKIVADRYAPPSFEILHGRQADVRRLGNLRLRQIR